MHAYFQATEELVAEELSLDANSKKKTKKKEDALTNRTPFADQETHFSQPRLCHGRLTTQKAKANAKEQSV